MKSLSLHGLCCFLILAGLSGSAPETESAVTRTVSAVIAPTVANAPGAGVAAEPPSTDAGAGIAAELPSSDPGAGIPAVALAPDPGADTSGAASSGTPAGPELLTATPVLGPAHTLRNGVHGLTHLVFDDDFDTLNTAAWTPYWFNDCIPKSVMNNVKTCSSNIKVANGEAVLQLTDAGSGALLSTNPKDGVPGHVGFEFTSGYAEARIYFPGTCSTGISNWPAWWTVGQRYPLTGEIDIAEPLAGHMWSVYHSAEGKKKRTIPACWAGAYHTYGLHRKAGANDVYYDGRLVHSYPTVDGNSPHYLILNVGVSAGSRVFGERGSVRVDYVRVWQ